MAPASPLPVPSFARAQALVPFPVFEPPGEVVELIVRPEGSQAWATVRSVHRFRGSLLRVKQFVCDWWPDMGMPKNLYHRTDPDSRGLEFYGPTETVEVHGQVGFHGRDYENLEAGSVTLYLVHLEIRIFGGSMGPAGLGSFLEGTRLADPLVAEAIAQRPLPLWSWSMRSGGRPPWPKEPDAPAPIARLRWYTDFDLGQRWLGWGIVLPEVENYRFDGVGVLRDSDLGHEECYLIYRSTDLHRVMEARFVQWGSRMPEAYTESVQGSAFKRETGEVQGFPVEHVWSPFLRTGRILAELPHGQLAVFFPPTIDPDPKRQRATAQAFIREFLRPVGTSALGEGHN